MKQMMQMMRNAGIKFTWDIITNSELKEYERPEEVRTWSNRYDLFDYVADADYVVQLSDAEGLPYTIQEALQYKTPCIVTDIGGMTELIKDGENGYVVPLDMNFDINRIKKIPKCSEYKNNAFEKWCDLLGGAEYKRKEIKIMKARVKCVRPYQDIELERKVEPGEEYIISYDRAITLEGKNDYNIQFAEIIEMIEEPEEKKTAEKKEEKAVEKPVEKKPEAKKKTTKKGK